MAIESPYLKAIQTIDGKTPGEKQKTINETARRIAKHESPVGDSGNAAVIHISDVPEPLRPLVRVEVAKILHNYEGIVEALKSEDITIVSRALQAKWFFDGSDTRLVNAKYFLDNVFPEISLHARFKVIRSLGCHLRNPSVAADFFVALLQRYGVSQATPLLIACDEEFAFKTIVDNKIVLSLRMAEDLYRKYPNMILKYLMTSKPDDDGVRNLYRIDISDYTDLLIIIANENLQNFMQIYRIHDNLDVKLGKRAVNTFIKTQLKLLIEKPDKYLPLLSLKTVSHKLSKADFARMFENLLPASKEDFNYFRLQPYLEFYKPEEESITLVLNAFRQKYGKDLLTCGDLVNTDLLKKLPTADRVKLARLKLEEDKDWHLYDTDRSWRTYLPTDESVPAIKKEIAKRSDASDRGQLLNQLVLTCKINDDKDALLQVLNYVYDRHRNDQRYVFYNCLSVINDSFDLSKLSSAHWESLDKYIKFTEVQDELVNQSPTVSKLLESALHYCLLNKLPMDDYLRVFLDMSVQVFRSTWNILTHFPDLEKKLLEVFVDVVPKQFPPDSKVWKEKRVEIIYGLASALWDFNSCHKIFSSKFGKLSIKDYPWLFSNVKDYIFGETEENDFRKESLLDLIRINEWDLYHDFIREIDQFWDYGAQMTYDVMKLDAQRVIDNWKICLEKAMPAGNTYNRQELSFVMKSRWYQQLPINFFDESISKLEDPEKFSSAISTLALLSDGETFSKIITPLIPSELVMDVDHPEARDKHSMLVAIVTNMRRVNPPVSLELIAKFCVSDYLQTAVETFSSVCSRVSVTKVIPFAETLTKKGVSVMKHGIRLICSIAPLEEVYAFLNRLWKTRSHTSIREVVFNQIYNLFCEQHASRSWDMLRGCIDTLNSSDDEGIFKMLTDLSKVPNDYLYEYIKSALKTLKSVEKNAENPDTYVDISCRLINSIDGPIMAIIPEEFSQHLIKQYLFVFDYDQRIFNAGSKLSINSFLLSSKNYNESRFEFFGNFFRDSVKKHWDLSHPKSGLQFYPMNCMTQKFFSKVQIAMSKDHDVRIFESFLEIFMSALEPQQDAITYVDLIFAVEYKKSETSADFGDNIARKISELVNTFSAECIISMSQRFSGFIQSRPFNDSETQDERCMTIVEKLANNGNIHCAFIAVNMLFVKKSKNLHKRYKNVVKTLKNFHHNGILWYLNNELASQEFVENNTDE